MLLHAPMYGSCVHVSTNAIGFMCAFVFHYEAMDSLSIYTNGQILALYFYIWQSKNPGFVFLYMAINKSWLCVSIYGNQQVLGMCFYIWQWTNLDFGNGQMLVLYFYIW